MCLLCAANADSTDDVAHRLRVLRLLALVEHPDALPDEAVLRLSREIMEIIGPGGGQRRCDSVLPDETIGEGR